MRVRTPQFDFSRLVSNWAPDNPEAAHAINASGVIPAYIEPFVIKVMNRAKPLLDPDADADLIADIETFNKQEGQHYKMHRAHLKIVREGGYEGMAEYEAALERDYEKFFAERSLRWLLAYCDGFEATGSLLAPLLINAAPAARLDPRAAVLDDLFQWHLAEEYEHRMVVFSVYERLYGKPIIVAWLRRVYGCVYAARHLNKHRNAVRSYLLNTVRAHMNDDEIRRSKQREREARGVRRNAAVALLPVLSPFYTPAKTPTPKDLEVVLDR
jgi:predicted metal-dependent hydrolase